MNKTEEVVSKLIGSALFDIPVTFDAETDWTAILKEAKVQAIVALVRAALPEDIAEAWKIDAYQSKAHFVRALYEQTKLIELLEKEGIPFVIIKGTAAAIYYPDPGARTMGDVDVFVGEKYFDAAFSIIKDNGYTFKTDYGDGRDYVFEKGDVFFEIHRRYSDVGHDIEGFILDGVENRQTLNICGSDFPALPKAENGLVLLDHIRHHLIGGLGLRQIIDFMMFVNSEPDESKFVSEYLPVFERAGLATFARVIVKTCKKYFGLPVLANWCMSADDRTCDELIEKVFSSGNFGRKDRYEYRPMRSFTVGVKKDGFFKTLQTAGLANCKAFERHRWLRPFAWVYQLIRYAVKGVAAIFKGEKLLQDIADGKKLNDFYDRLGF